MVRPRKHPARPYIVRKRPKQKKRRWAFHWKRCRICRRTKYRHKGKGKCESCYHFDYVYRWRERKKGRDWRKKLQRVMHKRKKPIAMPSLLR